MPLPDPSERSRQRICFFGDSQIASVKLAFDQGLLQLPPEVDVEFWGATGPNFRKLRMKDGRIVPDKAALPFVQKINDHGREALAPEDFDGFVFYGARMRVVEFFAPYLHRQLDPRAGQSCAVLETAAAGWLVTNRSYRYARAFSGSGAQVCVVPSPLPTEGILDPARRGSGFAGYPLALEAEVEHRSVLWAALSAVALRDGLMLLPQPEDTIASGAMTQARFAREGAAEAGDEGHKNPEFAAAVLRDWARSANSLAA